MFAAFPKSVASVTITSLTIVSIRMKVAAELSTMAAAVETEIVLKPNQSAKQLVSTENQHHQGVTAIKVNCGRIFRENIHTKKGFTH